jgi:hypothetical protein
VRLTQRTGELVIRPGGKGDRRRLVPLSRLARAALPEWLADHVAHRSQPSLEGGPLWISRTGEQMSVRSLGKIVSAVMDRAGIADSVHALRHPSPRAWAAIIATTSCWSPTSSATPTSRPHATTPAPASKTVERHSKTSPTNQRPRAGAQLRR